jgi:hypothetical protein
MLSGRRCICGRANCVVSSSTAAGSISALPTVRDEIDVLCGVYRTQRCDTVVARVADVETSVEHTPVEQSIAVGALGMRDGLTAPKEALRIVVGRSLRMVDAHLRRLSRRCGRAAV